MRAAKAAGYKSASVIHSTNAEFNSFGRVRIFFQLPKVGLR